MTLRAYSATGIVLHQDKLVVLFGLPGAFTGVCSQYHVPSYLESYDAIKVGIAGVPKPPLECLRVRVLCARRGLGLIQCAA